MADEQQQPAIRQNVAPASPNTAVQGPPGPATVAP